MYIWIYVHTYEGGAGCVLKDKSAAFRPLPHHSRVAVHEWDIEGFNKQFDHATKWPNESLILVYLSLPCLSPTKLTKSAASRIWISTYFVCRAHFYTWVHTYTRWERAGLWSCGCGVKGARVRACVFIHTAYTHTEQRSGYKHLHRCSYTDIKWTSEPWAERMNRISYFEVTGVRVYTCPYTLRTHTLSRDDSSTMGHGDMWLLWFCGCGHTWAVLE